VRQLTFILTYIITSLNIRHMEHKKIEVNGICVTCYADGSVIRGNSNRDHTLRNFGAECNGYRNIWLRPKTIYVHRLIAEAFLGDYSDTLQVDHINGAKDDNRPENLRMLTSHKQKHGYRAQSKGCSSGYRGVSWNKEREEWRAHIRVDGKLRYLGSFTEEIEAALAYNEGAKGAGFFPEALNRNLSK